MLTQPLVLNLTATASLMGETPQTFKKKFQAWKDSDWNFIELIPPHTCLFSINRAAYAVWYKRQLTKDHI
jgi:hypothetical protein